MGEYLSFVDGLLARLEGPLSFRFIVQPIVAIFFVFRDGIKDAQEEKPPFFWALLTGRPEELTMIEGGWKSMGKVFILAVVLDLIFQYIVFNDLRLIGALVAGVILTIIPYVLLRGLVNRFARIRRYRQ